MPDGRNVTNSGFSRHLAYTAKNETAFRVFSSFLREGLSAYDTFVSEGRFAE